MNKPSSRPTAPVSDQLQKINQLQLKNRIKLGAPKAILIIAITTTFAAIFIHLASVSTANSGALDMRLLNEYHPHRQRHRLATRLKHPCNGSIPNDRSILTQWPWSDWALSRFAAYYDIHRFLSAHLANRSELLQVLDFSGSRFLEPFNNSIRVTLSHYPDNDIHSTSFASDSFDIVTADQVLEHVNFPHLAMLEIHRLLRPKGIAMLTSVGYNPIHGTKAFGDVWRFMPDGMKTLSLPFRGGIKACGAWGTGEVVATRALHGMGSKLEADFHADQKWEQLVKGFNITEGANVFLVWIVVQK